MYLSATYYLNCKYGGSYYVLLSDIRMLRYVKVKLSLLLTEHHAMKAYWETLH
jgi:hypothetical protein